VFIYEDLNGKIVHSVLILSPGNIAMGQIAQRDYFLLKIRRFLAKKKP